MTQVKVTPADDYDVDEHGLISSPGKFEGEAVYVPHFWTLGLDGGADEDTYEEDPFRDGEVHVFVFYLTGDDRKRWPSLANVESLELRESENGFVFCDRLPQDGSFNEKNAAAMR